MTVLSFMLMFYVIYSWIRQRTLDNFIIHIIALDIILHTCVSIGYFLRFKFDFDYFYFTDILILVYGILKFVLKKRINSRIFLNYLFYIGIVIIGLGCLMIFPYKEMMVTNGTNWDLYIRGTDYLREAGFAAENIVFFLKTFVIATSVAFLKMFINMEMWGEILDKMYYWVKVILSVGIFEAISRYIFGSDIFNTITIRLFGLTKSTYDVSMVRGNGYMLQGLTREGSAYAYSLSILCVFLYVRSCCHKKVLPWMYTALGLMILSMSITAVYCIVFLLIMKAVFDHYMFMEKCSRFSRNRFLVVAAVILGGFLTGFLLKRKSDSINYMLWRIVDAYKTLEMVFNGTWRNFTGWYGSNQLRLISTWETLKLTVHRPFFGFGIGATTSHSNLAILLAEIGYGGAFCWYRFYFGNKEIRMKKREKRFTISIIMCYIAMNLLAGFERLIISVGNLFIFIMILKAIEERRNYEAVHNHPRV